jgi:hypothetical protein
MTIPFPLAVRKRARTLVSPSTSEAMFYGVAGDIVRTIEPITEADPIAILAQLICMVGSAAGRNPYFRAEADQHRANLFVTIVGESSTSRKGVSYGYPRRVLQEVDEAWSGRIFPGASSGEGLIWAVRDATEIIDRKGESVLDPGATDKRLLVHESEFGSVLRMLSREGNTLSAVLRNSWDGSDLGILTKNSPVRATAPHISMIGHITLFELDACLKFTEAVNGFANRFMWVYAKRSKLLPDGGDFDLVALAPKAAQTVGELKRDDSARALWHERYASLAEGSPGLVGAITSRGAPIVMRLALIYALLEEASEISESHMRAALAMWDYAERSAQFIFENYLGDANAERILAALRAMPGGLTRTEISKLFGRNRSKAEIDDALSVLVSRTLASCVGEQTDGRGAERWFAMAS